MTYEGESGLHRKAKAFLIALLDGPLSSIELVEQTPGTQSPDVSAHIGSPRDRPETGEARHLKWDQGGDSRWKHRSLVGCGYVTYLGKVFVNEKTNRKVDGWELTDTGRQRALQCVDENSIGVDGGGK